MWERGQSVAAWPQEACLSEGLNAEDRVDARGCVVASSSHRGARRARVSHEIARRLAARTLGRAFAWPLAVVAQHAMPSPDSFEVCVDYLDLCDSLLARGLGRAVDVGHVGKHIAHFCSGGTLLRATRPTVAAPGRRRGDDGRGEESRDHHREAAEQRGPPDLAAEKEQQQAALEQRGAERARALRSLCVGAGAKRKRRCLQQLRTRLLEMSAAER